MVIKEKFKYFILPMDDEVIEMSKHVEDIGTYRLMLSSPLMDILRTLLKSFFTKTTAMFFFVNF